MNQPWFPTTTRKALNGEPILLPLGKLRHRKPYLGRPQEGLKSFQDNKGPASISVKMQGELLPSTLQCMMSKGVQGIVKFTAACREAIFPWPSAGQ